MRTTCCVAFACVLVMSVGSPAMARMASIQTTAPLQDHEEQSIQAAIKDAVETAVKGAAAMGMSWVRLGGAVVLQDGVAVQVIASDTKPEDDGTEDQGAESGGNDDQQSQAGAGDLAGPTQPTAWIW